MLFSEDRQAMDQQILIESKNTGRQWRMAPEEVEYFFRGRRREWYRVFAQLTLIDTITTL